MYSKTILYFIIGILLSDILKGQCEDFIIESLPYTHEFSNIGQGNDWTNENYPNVSDVAYKLVLTEERTLFIDTCDPITDFDTILSIKD